MTETEAWVLRAGTEGSTTPGKLSKEAFALSKPTAREVLIAPIYGSWEANMTHAIERNPIDVCKARGEERVVLGNCGVVRVLEVGLDVSEVQVGDVCLFFGAGRCDAFGFMELAHAYDFPNSVGLLARITKASPINLVPIPSNSAYSLKQWAAFSGKYVTAWSNWRVALGAFRLQLTEADVPVPLVWGWGGGTTLAELDLARRTGCAATMISGNETHLLEIAALGIEPLDKRLYPGLSFDEARFQSDAAYADAYSKAERNFLREVARRTDGAGVSIFIDYIGSPVTRITLRALSRQGVLTTAGWKAGMRTPVIRAVECIRRHIHVHTHYARLSEARTAMEYGEREGWMPPEPETYRWEDVPDLAEEYAAGRTKSYFSVFEVNP